MRFSLAAGKFEPPSFCHETCGSGEPSASQRSSKVSPPLTNVSDGFSLILGKTGKQNKQDGNYTRFHKIPGPIPKHFFVIDI